MKQHRSGQRVQRALWACMLLVIAIVLITIVHTIFSLRSIEKNLPHTLLTELNMLSTTMESIADTVTAARIAQTTARSEDIEHLRHQLETSRLLIIELRDTYVLDNLVNASAFHAVVAPAVTDLQIWLTNGISGHPPHSTVTLALATQRISDAAAKAGAIKQTSSQNAQTILDRQRTRLERLPFSVSLLFAATVLVVICLIMLLFRQNTLQRAAIEAGETLQAQHDLLDSLLENLPLGIAVWSRDDRSLHVNHGFTDITGYDRNDLPTIDRWAPLAFPDPAYRQQVRQHWQKIARMNQPGTYRIVCKDEAIKEVEIRATFLPDGRIINTLMDVTERNRNERALQQRREIEARSKKMQSLGLLAGGVAHDLNNILSGIVSYPELLLLDLPETDPLRKPIEIMRESGLRATAIVQDLLTVARGVAVTKEPLNLHTIIGDYLSSPDYAVLRQHHPSVAVSTDLAEFLTPVKGSRAHLRKLLMNLVANACEAIDTSGSVQLSTTELYLDKPLPGYQDVRKGLYVRLTVADDGGGISREDLDRIFEPFYSRKVMGRSGTGLGLTVVWNVVEDHDGYITVTSSSRGTSFEVYLPTTGDPETTAGDAWNIADNRGSGETILVVDDSQSQRLITCEILKKLGYRPQAVASGEAAVAFLQDRSVDLVILDMIMDPGMNGRQTLAEILRIHPEQRAIIVSGFAETDDVKTALQLGAHSYVKKPMTIKQLGDAVRAALQQGAARG